jgi:replicative DNA helicase
LSSQPLERREKVSTNTRVIEAARRFDASAQEPMAEWHNEHAVLGAVLLRPKFFPLLANILQAGDFYEMGNGFIWHAYEELNVQGNPIDFRSVADFLDAEGKFEVKAEALVERLAKTANACPNPDHAEYYAQKVREAALRGRVIVACHDSIQDSENRGLSIDALVNNVNARMFKATEQYYERPTAARILASKFYDHVEEVQDGKSGSVLSGFKQLDALISFYPQEVTVFAGCAGMGKTTWVLSAIRRMCMAGKRIALFTLEMSADKDVMRALTAIHSGIAKRGLKNGDLTPAQRALFTKSIGEIGGWPLHIIDEFQNLTPTQLHRKLSYLMSQEPLDLVVIDGLWLMQPDSKSKENRPQDVANIMRALNNIAFELGIPILITHQLRRDMDNKPTLTDLAESAGAERNAQVVMALYRDGYRFGDATNPEAEIHILKDRNGDGTGKVVNIIYDGCGYREIGDGTI